MNKSHYTRTAFTLVEILIVVVILAILAVVAIPKLSNASQIARESTLKDDLRFLRNQTAVYRAQHRDVSPSYPDGNTASTPTNDDFVAQMTKPTNENGVVNGSGHTYGPYLSRMPDNPLNGNVNVKMLAADEEFVSDDNYGWLYKPATNEIRAANSGADSEQKAFLNY